MVAAIVLIWSTAYNLMYYTVYSGGFPAEWIPAARTILPAVAITLYVYVRGMKLPSLADKRWLWYGLMGFFGMTAPFLLLALGNERGVESGISSILTNGVTPLITIVLAHFLVKTERLSWRKSAGFIIGFIGAMLINTYVEQLAEINQQIAIVAKKALTLTLFLIGTGLTRELLRNVGLRPMILGLLLWIVISIGSLATILYIY